MKTTQIDIEVAVEVALDLNTIVPRIQPKTIYRLLDFARWLEKAYYKDGTTGINSQQANRIRKKQRELEAYVRENLEGVMLEHTPQTRGPAFKLNNIVVPSLGGRA